MPFDGSYDTVMLAREILSATPHPLRQLVPDLPLHVEAAITQALAKDKGLRFPSVLDFVRALHGLPLSSTVQLRRDAAVAPLSDGDRPTAALPDYGDRPTAALLDYGERPTAALLDYSDRPTAALQLGPELTAVVASSRSPPVEQTALLPALPVAPAQRASLAASAATPAQPPRPRRWRPLVAALGLVALGAAAGIAGSRPPAQSSDATPRAEPAPLASSESLQSRWLHPAEATPPALSSLPGRPEAAASSTCSCPPPPSLASPCPVSGGAGPSPGHRAPPTRHKLALKPVASAAVRRYLNRPD